MNGIPELFASIDACERDRAAWSLSMRMEYLRARYLERRRLHAGKPHVIAYRRAYESRPDVIERRRARIRENDNRRYRLEPEYRERKLAAKRARYHRNKKLRRMEKGK